MLLLFVVVPELLLLVEVLLLCVSVVVTVEVVVDETVSEDVDVEIGHDTVENELVPELEFDVPVLDELVEFVEELVPLDVVDELVMFVVVLEGEVEFIVDDSVVLVVVEGLVVVVEAHNTVVVVSSLHLVEDDVPFVEGLDVEVPELVAFDRPVELELVLAELLDKPEVVDELLSPAEELVLDDKPVALLVEVPVPDEVMFVEADPDDVVIEVDVMFEEVNDELVAFIDEVEFIPEVLLKVTVRVSIGLQDVVRLELELRGELVDELLLPELLLEPLLKLLVPVEVLPVEVIGIVEVELVDDVLDDPELARAATPIPIAAIIMITMITIAIVEMARFCLFIIMSGAFCFTVYLCQNSHCSVRQVSNIDSDLT